MLWKTKIIFDRLFFFSVECCSFWPSWDALLFLGKPVLLHFRVVLLKVGTSRSTCFSPRPHLISIISYISCQRSLHQHSTYRECIAVGIKHGTSSCPPPGEKHHFSIPFCFLFFLSLSISFSLSGGGGFTLVAGVVAPSCQNKIYLRFWRRKWEII